MNEGNAFRLIRKRMGLSQSELAAMISISQTSVSLIEKGIKRPSVRTIVKFCKAMDVPESIVYILGIEEMDIAENKRAAYGIIFPAIVDVALKIVGTNDTAAKVG